VVLKVFVHWIEYRKAEVAEILELRTPDGSWKIQGLTGGLVRLRSRTRHGALLRMSFVFKKPIRGICWRWGVALRSLGAVSLHFRFEQYPWSICASLCSTQAPCMYEAQD